MARSFTDDPETPTMEQVEVEEGQESVSENEEQQETLPSEVENLRSEMQKEFESRYSELTQKLARKERELQSETDRRISQVKSNYEREREELENQLNELTLRTMDEEERSKYQQRLVEKKLQKAQQLAEEVAQREQALQNMQDYIRGFSEMGVDASKLDISSPQTLFQSGWTAVQQELAELRAQRQENPGAQMMETQQPTTKTDQKAKPVAKRTLGETAARGTPPVPQTLPQVIKSVGDQMGQEITEDEFWRMIELGQLDPSILPGLS